MKAMKVPILKGLWHGYFRTWGQNSAVKSKLKVLPYTQKQNLEL